MESEFTIFAEMVKTKIINDPVYGFITIPSPLIQKLLEHPYVQRLRRIRQLGMSELVYPGATHSRFHHVLGAMHLMVQAINSLRQKGVKISEKEADSLAACILLHDLGHGPFSHSLEHSLLTKVPHEQISLLLMKNLNKELKGKLEECIQIFTNQHPRKFFHSLISGQLDMDRLDYLVRDSFYTGVSEGIIGFERIINMLDVVDDELVLQEKGIYSVEKFIIARRMMYWQVYLHKTVVAADLMLVQAVKRAGELIQMGAQLDSTPALAYFLGKEMGLETIKKDKHALNQFIQLDDTDVLSSLKMWSTHPDKVLSELSTGLLNRHLPKVSIASKPFSREEVSEKIKSLMNDKKFSKEEASYFVMEGILKNDAYKAERNEGIKIKMKSGEVVDVAEAGDNYNLRTLKQTVKKYYLSFYL